MKCKSCGFNATVEQLHSVRLEERLEKIEKWIKCMNPKHCGCNRCPNCNLFFEKIQRELGISADDRGNK